MVLKWSDEVEQPTQTVREKRVCQSASLLRPLAVGGEKVGTPQEAAPSFDTG